MKRLGFIVVLVGAMFSAAIGETHASPPQKPAVANHAQKHVQKHTQKHKSAKLAAQTASNTITGIELDCNSGGASGVVFFNNGNPNSYTGTVDLAVQFLEPGTLNTWVTLTTTTADAAHNFFYSVNYVGFSGATEYRVIVTGTNPNIGGVGVTSSFKDCSGSSGTTTTTTTTTTVPITTTTTTTVPVTTTTTTTVPVTTTTTLPVTTTTTTVPTTTTTTTTTTTSTPLIPIVVVNTPIPTATSTPTNTPVPPTATPTNTPTSTPVPPTNTPVPPTNTPVPPTATPAPTDTPVPPVPTNTPKPAPKATATSTAVAIASTATNTPVPAPTSPPPAVLPVTGYGGTHSAVAHNLAVGRVYRNANGNVTLGITGQPQTGGGNGPLGSMQPILPVVLGVMVVGLGVLTRKFAFARK